MHPAPRTDGASPRIIVSSHCSDGVCVGVALETKAVLVVDTKTPDAEPLRFTHAEWAAFVAGVKNGEFDLDPGAPHARS